jgi:hypothetical protein
MIVSGRLKGDLADAVKRSQISGELLKLVTAVTNDHLPALSAGQFDENVVLGFGNINGYQNARGCGRVRICHARFSLRVAFFGRITIRQGELSVTA